MALSTDAILTAALALLDREGLAKLSMRRLGAELGVEGMALYRHFSNKDALLDALYARILVPTALPAPSGDWRADAQALAHHLRDNLTAHPQAVPLLASRPARTEEAVELLWHAVGLLESQGVEEHQAVLVVQGVFELVLGHVLVHHHPRQQQLEMPEGALVVEADSVFHNALALMLEGLQARLERLR